jgi:hypothetical protein
VTQKPPTLSEVITAYQQFGYGLVTREPFDPADVSMLVRLSTSKEAAGAFAALGLSEAKHLTFVDDCVEAHRIDTGKHKAQVERLRRAPNYKKLQEKLESLVKDYGVLTEDVREAFRVIGVDLYYRQRDHEYDLLSTSRKGDKASARSRAIGWLKESVRRLSGQDNFEHVATLCDAVLNTGDAISLDSVKRAETPTKWLDRRFNKAVQVRAEKKR